MDDKLKELQSWLESNGITMTMGIEAPNGEQVKVENFIPKELQKLGWKPVLNLVPLPEKK